MKYLIILFSLFWTLNSLAISRSEGGFPPGPFPLGPFPLGSEIDFPWDDIEGFWRTREDSSIFGFKILKELENGTKVVGIAHYFSTYRGELKVFAEGSCFIREDVKFVTCLLSGNNIAYWVFVRAYLDTRSCVNPENQQATILTTRPENGNPKRDVHFWLEKVTGFYSTKGQESDYLQLE